MELMNQKLICCVAEYVETFQTLLWKVLPVLSDDDVCLPPNSSSDNMAVVLVGHTIKRLQKFGRNDNFCLGKRLAHFRNPMASLLLRPPQSLLHIPLYFFKNCLAPDRTEQRRLLCEAQERIAEGHGQQNAGVKDGRVFIVRG